MILGQATAHCKPVPSTSDGSRQKLQGLALTWARDRVLLLRNNSSRFMIHHLLMMFAFDIWSTDERVLTSGSCKCRHGCIYPYVGGGFEMALRQEGDVSAQVVKMWSPRTQPVHHQ